MTMTDDAERVPLADPFILLHDGVYYAYGTSSPNGIVVMRSTDLRTWQSNVGRAAEGLALHKEDSFGERGFWAPEVYKAGNRFHMYYSAERHTCAAVSDHPLGPFRQTEKKPLIADEENIDNTLFIDSDGKPYMFFSRMRADGETVWSVELEDDLLHVKPESLRYCICAEQDWELEAGRINEGSFVLKYKGWYYLSYSGNDCKSHDYGIGCAVAGNIGGKWEKYEHNPILQRCGGLVGIGHHSFFHDRDGALRIVFHAHDSSEKMYPRRMYIGTAHFREIPGEKPELVIGKDFISPIVKDGK